MSYPDWIVLISTLVFITVYGIMKSRGNRSIDGYLLGHKSVPWYTIGLSIMATQASAITFLSAPGQAFTDGMRFLQFYFGLPLAMIVLCVTAVPLFHRMKIYTAYEYLENRFDLKTRSLGALFFLVQRGLAAGLTIYAPAIILSSLLGWNIYLTNIFIGGIVIIYTVTGGTRAVSYTQMGQMAVIWIGIIVAAILLFRMLPADIDFGDVITIAGKSGKMNLVDFSFDINNRYNIWSGLIGGFFLALAYFGTDQSQVGRYLSGRSETEIRLGLLFNGLIKIPMQAFILFIGALLYVFYIFNPQPVFFNKLETERVVHSKMGERYGEIQNEYHENQRHQQQATRFLLSSMEENDEAAVNQAVKDMQQFNHVAGELREEAKSIIKSAHPLADTNDTNYIFLYYVTHQLPIGVIGLLIAVIFAASMSSTSSELNALASTTIIDIYRRSIKKDASAKHYVKASKWATVLWGTYAILVAEFANKMGSLIEAVNILGSLFYGTILGIFLVGFYFRKIWGTPVFIAALVAEVSVICCYLFTDISFLWYNVIGCLVVVFVSFVLNRFYYDQEKMRKPAR